MKTLSFYMGDDDLERIKAEQDRFAAMGMRVSMSAAIRSLIQRGAESTGDTAPPAPANHGAADYAPVQGKGKIFA